MTTPAGPASPDFQARRARARQELDAIDPALQGRANDDLLRRDWFGEVYVRAGDDPARVPWANLAPHPLTRAFVDGQLRDLSGCRVLDVGCGLGDNAEYLAGAGADVTAFDFVPEAIAWAQRRFPHSRVDYRCADLFELPPEWRGSFDLAHECYTLQAIAPQLLEPAFAALAGVLRPGGFLLLVARGRSETEDLAGPPWPLPPSVFDIAAKQGLVAQVVEDIAATADIGRRHWRALLRQVGAP